MVPGRFPAILGSVRAGPIATFLLSCLPAFGAGAPPPLTLSGFDTAGRPVLSQPNPANQVARLEASADLSHWSELARLHGAFQRFPDISPPGSIRFYRTFVTPQTNDDDWKNHALYPLDPLLSPAPGWDRFEPRWLKFAIVLGEPYRVHFQDSTKYAFHYDFAAKRLAAFQGMTRAAFDAVSLRREGQQVVLGAVLYAPTDNLPEIAVQFVGQDPYPREDIARWFELVRAVIELQTAASFYYFPTYEQEAVARANATYFAQRGITVSSAARWVTADECYAPGWALGRLVFVPVADLPGAYATGRLRPDDILLVDTVPAEVPPVAGIIALSPATPNSHVALLAQSFGIPFVFPAAPELQERLRAWDGQEIILRALENWGASELKAVNLEGQLTPELRRDLLALKAPPRLNLTPVAASGAIHRPADGLRPADIRFVGGKAANFGLLRRAVPANSPSPALAFTFDLWNAFLDQLLPGGTTLRARIQAELADFAWPPDMARLQSALARIRELFTDTADFSPAQRAAILDALQAGGFMPDRKIRFRSSTNVEDSEQFSGAGLYDSFSGCLADDLDGDADGPSACDPAETRERGVFRALRRVYASFYNDNAFLERLRHGVDESTVGMAVLVHHSTPDEFELANGVATAVISRGTTPGDRAATFRLVSQPGAFPVTNPEPNGLPEEVQVSLWSTNDAWLTFVRQSSLLPLGGHVLDWESEYRALVRLLDRAARAYEAEFPAKRQLTLDFEYKKVAPTGELRLKQIREVPPAASVVPPTGWLFNETNRWGVLQGEFGDVFANHRLKSFWRLQTANLALARSNLTTTFYRDIEAQVLDAWRPTTVVGELGAFPGFQHRRMEDAVADTWTWGDGAARRQFQLRTLLPIEPAARSGPLVFLTDGALQLEVTHATPQPVLDWQGATNRLVDTVMLEPVEPVSARSLRQHRTIRGKGLVAETSFYWPPNPTGPVAGYTAPVQAWIETVITGLTSRPITLRGEFSQTYHAGHHNFWEDFVFDPHLEESLDPELLDELVARNIRAIVGSVSFDETQSLWIWGLDDRLRRW